MLKRLLTKIILLVSLLVIIYVLVLYFVNSRYKLHLDRLSSEETKRSYIILNNSFSMMSQTLLSFVYDYTYWDEMVDFVKTHDRVWAEVNIDAVLPQFHAKLAWVFDDKFNQFYSYDVETNQRNFKFFLPKDTVIKIFTNNKFPHFFQSIGNKVYEISGAPIQHSDDLERKGKPNGYFLAARELGNEFIDRINSVTASSVNIISVDEYNKLKRIKSTIPEIIRSYVPLRDYNNVVISYLYMYYVNKGIKLTRQSYINQFKYVSVIGIIIIFVVTSFLIIWVLKPLREITKSILNDDVEKLSAASKYSTEFRLLSKALIEFIKQKQLIIDEINKRKMVEKELLKLSNAVKQNPISIIITDVSGKIEFVNPQFTNMTGYTYEDAINRKPNILKSGFHDNEFYKNMWDTILRGEIWKGEILNKRKDGSLFWCSLIIAPIVNDNMVTNLIGLLEDITEKKTMIKELIEAKEKAEEVNKLKSQFFAYMSHELRTPFMGLMGYADLIKETTSDTSIKEMADGILRSSKRMLETLTNILTITKLEFDQTEVNIVPINIRDILEEVYGNFLPSAETKNLKLIKSFNVDNEVINTDERILVGILYNLVNNAIKFTKEGFVEIIAEIKDECLILKVKDTGIGIPKEKLSIIFDEFRQVSEGYTREYQGTGLGLTIVKKYVDLLNGTIEVESEINKGTNFIVKIPV
ncbi:ATP-binding protein [Rosettibacter firmus]|uniref:ATP-binding protein n=1 Tax=Rosettibacter firmus TaxID=3111522 RepID=UPI00336BFF29